MRKVVIKEFGSLSNIEIESFEINDLLENDIIIKNELIGFNPVDYKVWEGSNLISKQIKGHLPWTPGFDICGEVIEVGSGVSKFKIGDRVCGIIGFPFGGGGYATHSKVEEKQLVLIPKSLGFKEAITCCLSGVTALQAYRYISKSKNSILILGGTGGVGFSLMCLLSGSNRKVYSTYRDKDGYQFINNFNGITPVNSAEVDQLCKEEQFDILDLIGGDFVVNLIKSNTLNISTLITVPTYSNIIVSETASQKGIEVHHFIIKQSTDDISSLLEMMINNKFELYMFKEFSLSEIREVFTTFRERSFRGKILIKVKN